MKIQILMGVFLIVLFTACSIYSYQTLRKLKNVPGLPGERFAAKLGTVLGPILTLFIFVSLILRVLKNA